MQGSYGLTGPRNEDGDFTMSKEKNVKHTSEELKKLKDESSWNRAAGMTDEQIEAADAQDPEAAGIDDAWMDNAEVIRGHSTKRTRLSVPDDPSPKSLRRCAIGKRTPQHEEETIQGKPHSAPK
jgi:hypothetical protein